jgi:hypothetical protein
LAQIKNTVRTTRVITFGLGGEEFFGQADKFVRPDPNERVPARSMMSNRTSDLGANQPIFEWMPLRGLRTYSNVDTQTFAGFCIGRRPPLPRAGATAPIRIQVTT